jgi:hypothetical protein
MEDIFSRKGICRCSDKAPAESHVEGHHADPPMKEPQNNAEKLFLSDGMTSMNLSLFGV